MTERKNESDRMPVADGHCSPEQIVKNAECLLGHLEVVQRSLRRKRFSEHAIDQALTGVYGAAMDYINGIRPCHIENRRGWVFAVGFNAAKRAAIREVRCCTIEPGILAALVPDDGADDDPSEVSQALRQLTERQYAAIDLCILQGKSQREAARELGISAGKLFHHLSAGKKRLKEILAPKLQQILSIDAFKPGARAFTSGEGRVVGPTTPATMNHLVLELAEAATARSRGRRRVGDCSRRRRFCFAENPAKAEYYARHRANRFARRLLGTGASEASAANARSA